MTERLFFALWPDGDLRLQLERLVPALLQGVAGKPQRPAQWHVTLLFLGAVPIERRAELLAVAEGVAARQGEIVFDRVEHWRKPRVLCLTAQRTTGGIGPLVSDLRQRVSQAGFNVDEREFRPHVTLARKVASAPAPTLREAIVWRAEQFALVRSVTTPAGSRYEPLHWWNLSAR